MPIVLLVLALGAVPAASLLDGASTRLWEHATEADFAKGTLEKLSLRSDGRLALAPSFNELHDAGVPYLWAVVEDSRGRVYFGGGGPDSSAKVFVFTPGGKGQLLAELPGLQVQTLAVDRQDRVYAATAPDGKVYRLGSGGKYEVFFDPKAKYIWALAFHPSGDLLVATGDRGEIHRVSPSGASTIWYRTGQSHARSMTLDPAGNLIVGTEPGGYIIRVSPGATPSPGGAGQSHAGQGQTGQGQAGQGFVLYQSPKREVTAVFADEKGNIYAAAIGTQQAPAGAPAPLPPIAPAVQPPTAPGAPVAQRAATGPPALPSVAASVQGGSEVYRIAPDGAPRRLWSHTNDLVYSIAPDGQGGVLLGTGNRGGLYRLDGELHSSHLLSASPTQITALAAGRDGSVYAVTGNIGKLGRLGPGLEKQGAYESEALDASHFTTWGRLRYWGSLNGGSLAVETRSGNVADPGHNWSPWAAVPLSDGGGRVASPAARFLQYRLRISAAPDARSPEIASVSLAYLQKNIAPVIEIVEATPFNYRFPPQSLTLTPSQNITLPPLGRARRTTVPLAPTAESSANAMQYSKGSAGVRWLARDENGDALQARVELRGSSELSWKLLKEEIRERGYSWDATAFPDGEYVARVAVSDSPDNPPGEALTASLASEPFTIDNSPPRITGLTGTRAGIRWKAADALNVIEKAEYSVNGGEWKLVLPTTRLTDSREHDYELPLASPPPGELTIAIRVTDAFENQALEKLTIR